MPRAAIARLLTPYVTRIMVHSATSYRYSRQMINGRYCWSMIPVSHGGRNRYASRSQLASSLITFMTPASRVRKRRLNSTRYDSYEQVVNCFLTITYTFLHKANVSVLCRLSFYNIAPKMQYRPIQIGQIDINKN